MTTWLLIALMAALPPSKAEVEATRVLCVEAGYGQADSTRVNLVAHVIDHRVRHSRLRRSVAVLNELLAPGQWSSRACRVSYAKAPAWLRATARRLVKGRMHVSPAPAWMTEDVIYVVAASEAKSFAAKGRELVKITWGLAFFRKV